VDSLRWHDLAWCLRRTPKKVLQLLKDHPGRVIASGGFVRDCVNGDKVNDLDLFVTSKGLAKPLAQALAGDNRLHETENAYTVTRGLGLAVQVIHRWAFTDAVALVDSFDFTIAKAAFWWALNPDEPTGSGRWESLCHVDFYADLAARRLVYVSPVREEEPGGSLLRVLKFYQRGYRIPLDYLGAVVARLVMKVDLSDRASEKRWAKVLTGLLREVDPNVDPNHLSHLPSQTEEVEDGIDDPTVR
jgi:hypothetical protein